MSKTPIMMIAAAAKIKRPQALGQLRVWTRTHIPQRGWKDRIRPDQIKGFQMPSRAARSIGHSAHPASASDDCAEIIATAAPSTAVRVGRHSVDGGPTRLSAYAANPPASMRTGLIIEPLPRRWIHVQRLPAANKNVSNPIVIPVTNSMGGSGGWRDRGVRARFKQHVIRRAAHRANSIFVAGPISWQDGCPARPRVRGFFRPPHEAKAAAEMLERRYRPADCPDRGVAKSSAGGPSLGSRRIHRQAPSGGAQGARPAVRVGLVRRRYVSHLPEAWKTRPLPGFGPIINSGHLHCRRFVRCWSNSDHSTAEFIMSASCHLHHFAQQKNSEPFRRRTAAAPTVKRQRKRRASASRV